MGSVVKDIKNRKKGTPFINFLMSGDELDVARSSGRENFDVFQGIGSFSVSVFFFFFLRPFVTSSNFSDELLREPSQLSEMMFFLNYLTTFGYVANESRSDDPLAHSIQVVSMPVLPNYISEMLSIIQGKEDFQ